VLSVKDAKARKEQAICTLVVDSLAPRTLKSRNDQLEESIKSIPVDDSAACQVLLNLFVQVAVIVL
jgi:hypothetical protein